MSLENRLAGPIIFAREENNELEKKKNSEKQSPLELHFHVRLFYCCVPYFNETLFLNPLFAGKRGDVCVIVKTIFFAQKMLQNHLASRKTGSNRRDFEE